MKKIQYILTSVALLAMAASCTLNQLEEPVKALKEGETFILTATAPGADAGTKTEVSAEGPEILWSPGDRIMVFSGENYWNSFTSTNTEPAARAEFQGYLSGFTGSIESQAEHEGFWAVYPYNHTFESIDVKGESITAYVPYAQNLTTGTFDPQALVSVARSHDLSLAFYNVCGGLKFKVAKEGIQQVEFKANGGEALAGIATVKMDALGYPKVEQVEGKSSSVILTAAYGESFKPGTWYYLPCLPATLAQGFTLTFRSTTETGVYRHPAAVEVKRSIWGVLENPEANVTFEAADNAIWYNVIRYTTTDESTITPQNISSFDFYNNSAVLVENTYENGQGILRFNKAVTQIPSKAFLGQPTLKSIILPGTVQTVGNSAFSQNEALTTVQLNEGLMTLNSGAFYYCPGLKNLSVPATVTELTNAFYGSAIEAFEGPLAEDGGKILVVDGTLIAAAPAAELGDYTIPGGVTAIGNYAFEDHPNLTALTVPGTVGQIGDEAFYGCEKLETVTVEEGVLSIGDYAFAYCNEYSSEGQLVGGLKTASLPGSLEEFGDAVFYGDGMLQGFSGPLAEDPSLLVFKGELKAIALGDRTEITVPSTVKAIGVSTFAALPGLTKVTLPASVESVGDYAFQSCQNLEEVDIQGNATFGVAPFAYCRKLTKFSGPMASVDGRCLTKDGVLFAYAMGSGPEYTIPDGITKIADRAFANSSIVSVTLNDGLKEIGDQAFYYCTQLSAIDVPGSVTRIGKNAFFFCPVKSITLHEGLQTIDDSAFYLCGNSSYGGIPEIVIPSTVTSIGYGALMMIEGVLQKVTMLPTTPPTLRGQLFWTAPVVYVPDASLSAYRSATNWSTFKNRIRNQPVTATCAQIIAGAEEQNFRVTGVCTSIKDTNYGNWYLQDETGEIYVYGTITPSGSYNWASFGIEVGDTVTLEGPKMTYKGQVELYDATVISVQKPS